MSEKEFQNASESGVPIWALDAGGQRCPDTGSGADTNSSFKHRGCMPNTSCYILVGGHPGTRERAYRI